MSYVLTFPIMFSGGYVANSLAIMTDALHMLTDLSGIILTLLALWLSAKSPTKRFTFGFHRLGMWLSDSAGKEYFKQRL